MHYCLLHICDFSFENETSILDNEYALISIKIVPLLELKSMIKMVHQIVVKEKLICI